MRHYSLLLAVTCLLASLTSCEKNDYTSYLPSWKGFQFTCNGQEVNYRTGIYAEDKIKITALQDQKGKLINGTTYNWTVTAPVLLEDGITWKEDSVLYKVSNHTNYDGTDNGDPSIEFTIPQNAMGNAIVKFSATYSLSGNGIQIADGSNYGSSSSVTGSIISSSSSMYGQANGSARFYINEK